MSSTPPFDHHMHSSHDTKWSNMRSVSPNQRVIAHNRPQFGDNIRHQLPYNSNHNTIPNTNTYSNRFSYAPHVHNTKPVQYASQSIVNQFNPSNNMNQQSAQQYSFRESMIHELNRGVYSSDLIPSMDTLRSIISTTNIKKELDTTRNKSSNDLTEDLKETDKEANKMKDLRKDVENKLKILEEELKYYEEKLKLRDDYKSQLKEINNKEELLAQKRTKLIEELSNKKVNYGNEVITSTNSETVKRERIKSEDSKLNFSDKTVKRSIGITLKTPIAKRTKFDAECVDEIKNLAKDNKNIVIKQLIDVKAQKANQTINKSSITSNKTSGVKTSRPQKPGTSRAFRETESIPIEAQTIISSTNNDIVSDTRMNDAIDDIIKYVGENEDENQTSINIVETEKQTTNETTNATQISDKTLKNINSVNESLTNQKLNDSQTTASIDSCHVKDSSALNESNIVNTSKVALNSNEQIVTKDNNREENIVNNEINKIVSKDESIKKVELICERLNSNNSDNVNAQKPIEVVELIDDEDVYTDETANKLKEEKNENSTNSKQITQKISHIRQSTESTDSASTLSLYAQENAEKTIKDDKDFMKTPPKKLMPKFSGWQIEEYPSTTKYSLPSFRAFTGPLSKTFVVKLMAFKDYLFASFGDFSVRRYTIDGQVSGGAKSCQKFEGHTDVVWDLKMICADIYKDIYHLYTGCNDRMLRRFNPNTGILLKVFHLDSYIYCIDYCWSHLFVGQMNGFVAKIKYINEISDDLENDKSVEFSKVMSDDNTETIESEKNIRNDESVEKYCVARNKHIKSIRAIRTDDQTVEPLIAVSNNKLRIINTKSSVEDSQRVLFSMNVDFHVKTPIRVNVYENYMFITFTNAPRVKNEETKKAKEESHIYIYELGKFQKPIRQQLLESYVTSLEFNKRDVVLTCFKGEVRCFDAIKHELKWIAYHSGVITASVNFGDRIVVGDEEGTITGIYLDTERPECDMCFLPFARKKDLKDHIMRFHPIKANETQSSTISDPK